MSRDSPMTHPTPADLVKELRADAENCRAEKDGGHMDDVLEAQAQRNEAIAAALSSTQVREKKLEAELVEVKREIERLRGQVTFLGDKAGEKALECGRQRVRAESAESSLTQAREALKPFAAAFEKAREKYASRYSVRELGFHNFDKMPDQWAMDSLEFNMGDFRRARTALAGEE